jgi:hypothetical protein
MLARFRRDRKPKKWDGPLQVGPRSVHACDPARTLAEQATAAFAGEALHQCMSPRSFALQQYEDKSGQLMMLPTDVSSTPLRLP